MINKKQTSQIQIWLTSILIFSYVFLLNSCGNGKLDGAFSDRELLSIEINVNSKDVTVSKEKQFTAIGHYSGGLTREMTDLVEWSSSDEAVAQTGGTEGHGKVKGKSVGTVTIIATDPLTGISGAVNIDIIDVALVSIKITPGDSSLVAGDKLQFRAVGTFAGGAERDITELVEWRSSDKLVASVSNDNGRGLVEGNKFGNVNISVVHAETGLTSFVALRVEPLLPTEGLVAYYPFNGNAKDESGNGNDGIIYGSTETIDYLYTENGVDDYLVLPASILNGVNDFSFVANVRLASIHESNFNSLLSAANSQQYNELRLTYKASINKWELNKGGTPDTFDANSIIEDGRWHHLALVRSGDIARLFIDGTEIGIGIPVSDSPLNIDKNGLLIGQEQDSLGGTFEGSQSWAGGIDEVRFYNRALTEKEIKTLYRPTNSNSTSIKITTNKNSITKGSSQKLVASGKYEDGTEWDITSLVDWTSSDETIATVGNSGLEKALVTGKSEGEVTITATDPVSGVVVLMNLTITPIDLTEGLVAYYPFNGNAKDESGNGNDGFVKGATLTADRFGNEMSAYSFDGNDEIDIGNNAPLSNLKALTISLWYKKTGSRNQFEYLFGKALDVYSGAYALSIINHQGINGLDGIVRHSEGLETETSFSSSSTYDNQWHHVVMTFDENHIKIYLDNQEVSTTLSNGADILNSPKNAFIGSLGSWLYFIGTIHDVHLFSRSLSIFEIQTLFSAQ